MARGVRYWLGGTLGACLLVALAYLPPRGSVPAGESRFAPRIPKPTPARLREQDLAEEWRAVQSALQLLQSERDMGTAAPVRAEDGTSLSVLVDGPDSVVALLRPWYAAQLDTVWHQLGLSETKIAVRVVVATPRPRRSGVVFFAPAEDRGGATYLLPDSSDRTTCAVLIPASYFTITMLRTRRLERVGQFREWLKNSLGPCAFYAAYGTPGKPVRRWLARRGYDLALYPIWNGGPVRGGGSVWLVSDPTALRAPWFWESLYHLPPLTIGCMAGRMGACRDAVLSGSAEELDDSLPRVVSVHLRWWKDQPLVPGERYLADVARDVGHDRFLRFWSSTEPVDTALAVALKMPIGDWTTRWERRFVPKLPLGPAAPPSAVLLALLLAVAVVATVAVTAGRRQVR